MLGNRVVAQLIQARQLTSEGKILGLQCKRTGSAADDRYAPEADGVARHVMHRPDAVVTASAARVPASGRVLQQSPQHPLLAVPITPIIQQQRGKAGEEEADSEEEAAKPIQAPSAGALRDTCEAGADVETQLSLSKGRCSPLPAPVRAYMEPRFGVDFGHVHGHTGSAAQGAAPVPAAMVAQRVEAAVPAPAAATADEAVCPVCGGQEKEHCSGCGQSFVSVQRLALAAPPAPAGLDQSPAAMPAAGTTAAPPVLQRTAPALHRLGLSDVVSLGRDAAIRLIGRYAPGLAEFIRNGPMAMLVETIKRGVQTWLRGLLGSINISGALSGLVSSLTSAFAAIRASDNPACATLAASIDGLRQLGQAILESPAITVAQTALSAIAGVFQKISDVVIGAQVDTILGLVGGVTDLARTIWGWIVTAKDALGVAWDTVKTQLGLDDDEHGIIATLKAKAAEGWEAIKQGLAPAVGPLKTMLKLLLVFSPAGPTILIIKYLPPLVETVQWLWAHKGDADLIKSSQEAGHTVLPKLLSAVQGFSQGVQAVASTLMQGAQDLHEAILSAISAITGLPLLSIAQGLMQALADGVQQLVTLARTGIEAAATAIGALFQKAQKTLQPLIDVLVPLGMCIVNPTMIPLILGGKAWLALDDCYKAPLIDFLLDVAIGLLKKAPDVSMFGPLWQVLRQGVIGFLEGVRGRSTDEKVRITNKLAMIVSGGNPAFMVGFAKGLLIGLWKGLKSPFELVYDLIKLLNHVLTWAEQAGAQALDQALAPAAPVAAPTGPVVGATPVPVPATGPAPTAVTPAAPAAAPAAPTPSGNGAGDPEQAALRQKLGQLAREVGPPVKEVTANFLPAMQETFSSGGGMTYADIKTKFGSLLASAEAALHKEGQRLADIACQAFLNDANDAQLGEEVGDISGQILFEIILLVLTEGLIEALKPLQGIAKMLDFVGEAMGAAIKWLGKIGGWVVDGVKGLWKFVENSGAGKKVVQALQHIGEILMRYADELLGLVGKKAGGEAVEVAAEQALKEFGPRATKFLENYGDDFTRFVTHYGPDASKLSDTSIEGFLKWKKGLSAETQQMFADNPALWRTWADMNPSVRSMLTLCKSPCIPPGADPSQAKRILDLIDKHKLPIDDPVLKEYLHLHGGSTGSLTKALDDLDGATDVADLHKRITSITDQTTKELRDRLGPVLYDELLKEMPPSMIADLEQKLGKAALEELAKTLSPKTLKALADLSGPEIKTLVDEFGPNVLNVLGPELKGKGLQELQKLDMFTFDPAKAKLIAGGQGQAVQVLPPLQGKTRVDIENTLTSSGFTKAEAGTGMDIWIHPDGSVVRIKHGPKAFNIHQPVEHLVKEISKKPGAYGKGDVFAKVADDGTVVPVGTKFAEESLRQWFKKKVGRDPTAVELERLMLIWGKAGHVPFTP
jgi:hypothetical protein